MRKRNFIILICLLVAGANSCFAQRRNTPNRTANDYTTDTLRMGDYTYICDTLKHVHVTLRNIEDHPGREELCYADGTQLEEELAFSLYIETVVMTSSIDTHLQNIVNDAFSQEQVESLEGRKLRIELNISSSSGEITDVYFNFPAMTGYADIPIDVYRNMEVRFKNEICFELTELGRKLNYCLLSWTQCPSGRVEEIHNNGENDANTDNIRTDNIGTITINKGTPTTNRGTMTPIGGFGKGTTTNP